jgi:HEPN domain-containing protein
LKYLKCRRSSQVKRWRSERRRESARLWEQAQEDLDTADKLIRVQKYYASAFFSEQAAEKVLKAMYLERKRRAAFTHDLIELAEELSAPENAVRAAVELSPDYLLTRYPDAANAVPARLYDRRLHGCTWN